MKVTVTTESQELASILSETQLKLAKNNRSNIVGGNKYDIILQNLGVQDVYVDFSTDATIANGLRVKQDEVFTFTNNELSSLNLISDTTINTDIRILIN